MPEHTDHAVHAILSEWVKAIPHPLLIWGDGGSVIFENKLWNNLFETYVESKPSFNKHNKRLHLPLESGEFVLSYEDLLVGDYFVKSLRLRGPQAVNLEVVKVEVAGEPYFCCMLIPSHHELGLRFGGLLDSIHSWILEIAGDGRIIYANAPVYQGLGFTDGTDAPAQLDHMEENLTSDILQTRILQVDAKQSLEYEAHYRRSDGELVPSKVTMVSRKLPDGNKNYLLSVQQAIRKEEGLFGSSSPDGVANDGTDGSASLEEFSYLVPAVFDGQQSDNLLRQIEQVAPTDVPVLITGEAGTGKKLIGKLLHRMSQRSEKPFVQVRCDSLPTEMLENELFGYEGSVFTGTFKDRIGRVEAAQGGTLLLYEIGHLTLPLQRRIMKMLQEGIYQDMYAKDRPIDIRLIATSTQDLSELVENGKFRDDLCELLMGFPITSRSLRERRQDIPTMVRHFIKYYNRKYQRKV
ncbi:MAG: sigma 54-interacting transcriptional regulator, partial [Lewinella sp.]